MTKDKDALKKKLEDLCKQIGAITNKEVEAPKVTEPIKEVKSVEPTVETPKVVDTMDIKAELAVFKADLEADFADKVKDIVIDVLKEILAKL